MTQTREIRPIDVLHAIFSYTRDVGPVSERVLRKTLRLSARELGRHLQVLREQGCLTCSAEPRLTFVGLCAAARAVPTYLQREAHVQRRHKVA